MSCKLRTTVSGNVGLWFRMTGLFSFHLAEKVVKVAEKYGYSEKKPEEIDSIKRLDSAEMWMNKHVVPEGYYFGGDPDGSGGWGMFKIRELKGES